MNDIITRQKEGETYPPDKQYFINEINDRIKDLNELEEETENTYRWDLVKVTQKEKQKKFYSVSGIMICFDCIQGTTEFEDITNMTLQELMNSDNKEFEDIEDYMTEKDIEVLKCEGICGLEWRLAEGEP